MLPTLAEIADKMPTALDTFVLSSVLAASCLGAGRLWRPATLLFIPALVIANCWALGDVQDPHFAGLIAQELGDSWLYQQAIAANLPFAIGAIIAAHRLWFRRERVRWCSPTPASPPTTPHLRTPL